MATIKYQNMRKVYPDGTEAIPGFTLDVEDGEFMVFVGPSGCGKSTALRMTAGLEEITGGRLYIGDELVNGKSPRMRGALYRKVTQALPTRRAPGASARTTLIPSDASHGRQSASPKADWPEHDATYPMAFTAGGLEQRRSAREGSG